MRTTTNFLRVSEHTSMLAERTRRLVEALTLSAPWALCSRYEELSHCMEASVCGVEVLGKYGIHARVFPCSVVAAHQKSSGVLLGFSREDQAKISQGEMHYMGAATPHKDGFHCAIEVEEQLIVDLTLGQLWEAGVDVSPTFVFNRADLETRQFRTPGDWCFAYEHGTQPPPELEEFKNCDHSGLTEDFEDLVKLALHVGRDLFLAALPRAIGVDVFTTTFQRIHDLRERTGKSV